MRVALITGSYPPDACGVGDYTYRLVVALQAFGVTVDIISGEGWGIRNAWHLAERLDLLRPDVIHIQYPTVGYGTGVAPQVVSLLRPGVVTLHEVSQAQVLRRLSLYPFSISSKHMIFTNTFDRDYARTWAPWISSRSSVIPIASNIPIGGQERARNVKEIIYFGLIRPNKGLEDVLALASLIQEPDYPVRIIGSPDPRRLTYLEDLRSRSEALPVTWDLGLSDTAIADLLSRSRIAYVPFPDGASERRGSLLALLGNGVATVTTRGSQTPADLDGVVEFVRRPEEALKVIRRLVRDEERRTQLSSRGQAYAARFTWDAIAAKHIEVYQQRRNRR